MVETAGQLGSTSVSQNAHGSHEDAGHCDGQHALLELASLEEMAASALATAGDDKSLAHPSQSLLVVNVPDAQLEAVETREEDDNLDAACYDEDVDGDFAFDMGPSAYL